MNFYMPTKLITGSDCIQKNAGLITNSGTRCLIVTGTTAAKRSGALDDVTAVLQESQIPWQVYNKIQVNPTVASVLEGCQAANAFGADFIIGIGGGSALDAAKVIAVSAANPQLDAEDLYKKLWTSPRLPLLLVGTTAGTGSEVTPVAVLTDAAGKKRSIRDDCNYADISFGDPKYTLTLPRKITISTGVDAVTHCVESYFSKKANHISRAFALQGMELLLPPLQHLTVNDNLSYQQREALYHGSILAGLAISITGTVFAHNVGYYFSEHHGLPHGDACALFLPELLAHTSKCAAEYTDIFCKKLNTTTENLTALISTLMPQPNITLTEELIDSILPRWENNGSVMNTIGTVTTADIKNILMAKFVN